MSRFLIVRGILFIVAGVFLSVAAKAKETRPFGKSLIR